MLGSSAGCSGKVPPGVEVRESVQGPSQCAWLFSLCTEARLCLLRGNSLSCTIWAFLWHTRGLRSADSPAAIWRECGLEGERNSAWPGWVSCLGWQLQRPRRSPGTDSSFLHFSVSIIEETEVFWVHMTYPKSQFVSALPNVNTWYPLQEVQWVACLTCTHKVEKTAVPVPFQGEIWSCFSFKWVSLKNF